MAKKARPFTATRGYAPATDRYCAAAVLAEAFADDPVAKALFRSPALYARHSVAMYGWLLWAYHASFGITDVGLIITKSTSDGGEDRGPGAGAPSTTEHGKVSSEISCTAVWEPATMGWFAGLRVLIFLLWCLCFGPGPAVAWRCVSMFVRLEDKRYRLGGPSALHLQLLGTSVALQGCGIGAALLRRGLTRADGGHSPCYLESSNPRNVPFYERHGFVTVEEYYPFEDDGAKGPLMTLMRRKGRGEGGGTKATLQAPVQGPWRPTS